MIGLLCVLVLGGPDGYAVAANFEATPGAKASVVRPDAAGAIDEGAFREMERAIKERDAITLDRLKTSGRLVPLAEASKVTVVREVKPERDMTVRTTTLQSFQRDVQSAAMAAGWPPVEVRVDDGPFAGKTFLARHESLGVYIVPSPAMGAVAEGDRVVVLAGEPLAYAKEDGAYPGFVAFARGKTPQGMRLPPGSRHVVVDRKQEMVAIRIGGGTKGAGKTAFVHRSLLAPAGVLASDRNGKTSATAPQMALMFAANLDQMGYHVAAREQYRRLAADHPRSPEAAEATKRLTR